jgi:oligopeptide transport system substrate-binding protein
MTKRRAQALALAAVIVAVAVAVLMRGDGDQPELSGEVGPESRRKGGVLRLGVVAPSSLDPARARTVDELLVAEQLFDSLTAYDPRTLEPVPGAAARWQASPDQLHWEFFLKPQGAFANGRAVTSADVKYSLERIVRKETGSSVSDLLEPVRGYKAFNQGEAPELAGVTTPAPDVVAIDLDHPLAELPALLGSPAFAIVPREAVEAPDPAFGEHPVGNGPFQIRARSPDTISLVPAPGASGADILVEGVEVVLFDDVTSSYEAFTRKELDWSQVPPEHVDAAAQRYGRSGYQPYLAELFYAFNVKSPKFADPRFREAIVQAIDRRAIVSAVYGGTVRVSDGLVVAGVPGHQPDPCGGRCAYDPNRATALLAEVFAGAPVPEIGLDYDDDKTQEAVAKAIQANLAQAGIPAVLRPRPLKEYQEFAVTGNQELFRLGWIAAYPSPDAFLPPLFSTGSSSNLTGLSAPAVDENLRAARAEPDGPRRLGLYQAAERAIFEQVPVVPLAQFEIHSVVAPRVRDLVLSTAGTFDGSRVWLRD